MRRRHRIHAGFALSLALGALAITPAHAGLFGESDEEKAARIHEQNQDATIQDLTQRMHDLEESLRQATGQNESLAHQVQQLNDKLERQKKDFDYRLCTLTAQQMDAADSEQGGLSCGAGSGASATYNMAPPPPQSSDTVHLAPPPGILGTLPAKQAAALPRPAANPQTKSQFDAALDLAGRQRYDDARAAFRNFADNNPGDELAPEAVYWVGEISYTQKDYAGAAHAFAEQIKKYPTSPRGPDSMLKLGQSLIAMGQTREGCLTLGALPSKYPGATKKISAQAAGERKASCK